MLFLGKYISNWVFIFQERKLREKFIFRFRQLRRQMLLTRSLMISATDQYWSSGRKTCINHSYNLTSWDQSSANDAAVVHPFWLILLMQAFPNDVINGLQCKLYILLNHIVGQDLSIIKLGAVLRSFLALVWHLRTWSPWKTQPFTVHTPWNTQYPSFDSKPHS